MVQKDFLRKIEKRRSQRKKIDKFNYIKVFLIPKDTTRNVKKLDMEL